jgi:hypothetical protein
MKKLFTLLCFLAYAFANAQPPAMELQPYGFDPIVVTIPSTGNEKLIELSKEWAAKYNDEGADVTPVAGNSVVITALKRNAFYYRNNGVPYDHMIQYTLKIVFSQNSYTLVFSVDDIYHDDVLLKYKIPDYFTSEGDLKEGYEEIKPSLESTVNNLVKSHYNFLMNFR